MAGPRFLFVKIEPGRLALDLSFPFLHRLFLLSEGGGCASFGVSEVEFPFAGLLSDLLLRRDPISSPSKNRTTSLLRFFSFITRVVVLLFPR